MSGRDIASARFDQSLLNHLIDAAGNIRIDEGRYLRVLVVGGAWFNLRQSFSKRLRNLSRMCGHPHTGSIDTGTPAVINDGSNHNVQIPRPFVNAIFANDYLAITWAVNFDS